MGERTWDDKISHWSGILKARVFDAQATYLTRKDTSSTAFRDKDSGCLDIFFSRDTASNQRRLLRGILAIILGASIPITSYQEQIKTTHATQWSAVKLRVEVDCHNAN
jgi:hypothetical protein